MRSHCEVRLDAFGMIRAEGRSKAKHAAMALSARDATASPLKWSAEQKQASAMDRSSIAIERALLSSARHDVCWTVHTNDLSLASGELSRSVP